MKKDIFGQIEKDIIWYLNDSDAAMGYSSNWFATINTSTCIPATAPEPPINFLKAIARHRKIHNLLKHLERYHYRYIQALYLDDYQSKYPPLIRIIFKETTGLALCLFYDQRLLERLCRSQRHNTICGDEAALLIGFRQQVDAEFVRLRATLISIFNKKEWNGSNDNSRARTASPSLKANGSKNGSLSKFSSNKKN